MTMPICKYSETIAPTKAEVLFARACVKPPTGNPQARMLKMGYRSSSYDAVDLCQRVVCAMP